MQLSIPQIALLSRLLDEALPLDAAGRRIWLERLSPEYQDLIPALRKALLPTQALATASEALATLPKLTLIHDASAMTASGLQAGTRVGPYELIRPLGAGGMAQVWLARRADGAFKREVALKLPTLTHLRAELEQRFARERDILASLEHPQIARFYDAGVDPNGLPYVAMEYVQGQPLTSWCDAHRLGVEERLKLFLQVLEAMQYAHDKQVIHRDLKPSNILVTEFGQVRLLDFGVAKLLEAEEADQTPLTSLYGRALTPDYASPELLRGDPLDARSDVYSLGVVLYELLTGVRPYHLKSAASMGLLEQAIATVEVRKPSTKIEPEAVASCCGTTPEKLAHQLRGDLDAMALKALAKEPAERYPSASALTEDLRRYLEGKPIQARPTRLPYRLSKFVRRNRAIVTVSATAIAAILAAFGYLLYREAVYQVKVTASAVAVPRDVIPEKSIAVLPFVDMSEKHDQEYFSDGLVEELLNMLAKAPELHVAARTSSSSFKGKQTTVAEIGKALGVANVLEGSVRKSGDSIRITAQLVDTRNGYHIWSETYDRPLRDIFKVQDEIATSVARALQVWILSSPLPSGGAGEHAAAYSLALQCRFLGRQASDDEDTRACFRRVVTLDPNYAPGWAWVSIMCPPSDPLKRDAAERAVKLAPDLPDAHAALGFVFMGNFNFKAAETELSRALAIDSRNLWALRGNAVLALALGRSERAIDLFRRATEIDPLAVDIWWWLGDALESAGQFEESAAAYHRMLEIRPTRYGGHDRLAAILLLEGKTQAALAEEQKEAPGEEQTAGLAIIYYALRQTKAADAALERLKAENGNDSPYDISTVYAFRNQKDQAFKWLDRAYAQKDDSLWVIKSDPLLKDLEGDPRYKVLLRKMNLPE